MNSATPTSGRIYKAFYENFLGHSPKWYKSTICLFLLINPFILLLFGPYIAGWVFVIEFIFTLAMALKCYPLQPGGLLTMEALALGMTTPDKVAAEVFHNFPVILLLMFMVAGIYFMKDLLLFTFTKILINIRNKRLLSILFCVLSAALSAFLDALTVTAVVISVATGFYSVYHKVSSGKKFQDYDATDDADVPEYNRIDLEKFRAFLRSLMMHAAIGTALGGVCTTVGEPQNLLIAKTAGWDFATFFLKVAPVSMPVFVSGIIVCYLLERFKVLGYGQEIPENVLHILKDFDHEQAQKRTDKEIACYVVQALAGILLVIALAFHIAEVGLIGLAIIVLQTAFNGVTEEHAIGHAFEEAMPFTALLVVFFAIVALIHEQHLFEPITQFVLGLDKAQQPGVMYIANGLLSMISDNVFVATIYIAEIKKALDDGGISVEHFNNLAVAINTGTNLPSVATPNGQAAFLFLLTSSLAPLIRLSYGKMVLMALPYTLVLGGVGYFALVQSL